MRTRGGLRLRHPKETNSCSGVVVKRRKLELATGCRKKSKISPATHQECDYFDALPDDIILCILTKLSSTAQCPAHFINLLITCKRLNGLGLNSLVLSKSSRGMVAVKAKNWSESAHRFLKLCADTGNVEACYTLGMIRFYCLQKRGSGASLMAKAAMGCHAAALHSLGVIQFNGSGGSKKDKDLRSGVALCARAAFLGHVDALREVGHCLHDGYGVKRNVGEGRRFLVEANARELLLSDDLGCHPANQFLWDWFVSENNNNNNVSPLGLGLRLCSNIGCGRAETRRHEFRRCSVCGAVNYCSRACQALHWKLRHKLHCTPLLQLHPPAPAPAIQT